jgi:hypothetical protein
MNISKLIREELIKEVGNIERSYKWEGPLEDDPVYGNVGYFFTNDKGSKYIVKFERFPDDEWERSFTADGKYLETEENDVYRVMSTVTEITLDFIDQYEPLSLDIPHIGTKKEVKTSDKSKTPNKRARLNQIYLGNNLPGGYTYSLKGSTSIIKKYE